MAAIMASARPAALFSHPSRSSSMGKPTPPPSPAPTGALPLLPSSPKPSPSPFSPSRTAAEAQAGPRGADRGPEAPSIPSAPTPRNSCCPSCGLDLPTDDAMAAAALLASAQKQISDLQAQVRLLNTKATTAVDRWADYEDELELLRAQLNASKPGSSTTSNSIAYLQPAAAVLGSRAPPTPTTPSTPSHVYPPAAAAAPTTKPSSSFIPAGAAGRITALWTARRSPVQSSSTTKAASTSSPYASGSPSAKSTPALLLSPPPPGTSLPPTPSTPRTPAPQPSSSSSSASSPFDGARSASSTSSPPSVAGDVAAKPLSASSSPSSTAASAAATTTADLLEALSREQTLRRAAEGRLQDTSREVEELSVSLFEQANEMVAAERRARARLEERVEVLERRDVDKRRRLERLESAMGRIEKVRALLAEPDAATSG